MTAVCTECHVRLDPHVNDDYTMQSTILYNRPSKRAIELALTLTFFLSWYCQDFSENKVTSRLSLLQRDQSIHSALSGVQATVSCKPISRHSRPHYPHLIESAYFMIKPSHHHLQDLLISPYIFQLSKKWLKQLFIKHG
jgi:hypothetical protein